MTDEALAHLDGERGHSLSDHLLQVGRLAEGHARHCPGKGWAGNAGRVHDLGKNHPSWQSYLRGLTPRIGHASVGAIYAVMRTFAQDQPTRAGLPLAYVISGHHAGLPDWEASNGVGRIGLNELLPPFMANSAASRDRIAAAAETLYAYTRLPLPDGLLAPTRQDHQIPLNDERFSPAFWIRMLFSSLVDADFIDTEAFYSPAVARTRLNGRLSLVELKASLDAEIERKAALPRGNERLHELRQEVLAACRASGQDAAPGLKRLNVPTGLGKTLSGMMFALEHAIAQGKDRVIYVAPYLGIIDQTAAEFRRIFGDDAVLEHHSGTDPDTEDHRAKLAAENWDAPIVVTTSVQLFESLYANRPSRCRKLHNITGSVLIIDEAQCLPPGCIAPAAHAIEQLVRFYGTTIVLMTATQLGLEATFPEMPKPEDIVVNSARLHTEMRRVRIELPTDWSNRVSVETVASWMHEQTSVLTIVDSRADARRLFADLGLSREDGAYHLSTFQCPAHRRRLIQEIRDRLADQLPTKVVSTRLIEAGVDVDFPAVFRAVAGLDSLIQAGGRANREGRLAELGLLRVFRLEGPPLHGNLHLIAEVAMRAIDLHRDDPFSVEAVQFYFRELHRRFKEDLDENEVLSALAVKADTLDRHKEVSRFEYYFQQAADRFRMIDSRETGVVVDYGEGQRLIAALRAGAKDRSTLRRAAQHSASLPTNKVADLCRQGDVEATESGIYVQIRPNSYNEDIGWVG